MPLKGVKYRTRQTSKGPQRLAISKKTGRVREVKNLKTGKTKKVSD